jgi:hypothetical protein
MQKCDALKSYISLYMEMNRNNFPQLCDHNWVRNFAFLADVTQHPKEVHIDLQETNNLIDGTDTTGFEMKLRV